MRTPVSARSRLFAAPPDGLAIVGVGALLWAVVFLLFTFRSFTLGLPYVGEQAGLRCIMMGVGAGLCALLYLEANRIRGRSWRTQSAILGIEVLASGAFYSSANYALLYVVWADLPDATPALPLIVGYFTSTVWIFALWLSLVFLVRNRSASLGASAAEKPVPFPEDRHLWFKHKGGMVRIRLEDIDWAQSEGDYVRFHVDGRSYLHRMTLEGAESLLESLGFIRVHRRFLVPIRSVERVARASDGRRVAILTSGLRVPVGRAYAGRIRNLVSGSLAQDRRPLAQDSWR